MKAGLGAQRSQVKFLERARIVGNKGIDTSDLMAALEQFLAEMGTDKSGGSSDNAGCHVGRVILCGTDGVNNPPGSFWASGRGYVKWEACSNSDARAGGLPRRATVANSRLTRSA